MYLVNESSKLEPVNRDYIITKKSQSLLDHPRIFGNPMLTFMQNDYI